MSYLLINTSSYFRAYAVIVNELSDNDPAISLATLRNKSSPGNADADDTLHIVVGRFWTKSFKLSSLHSISFDIFYYASTKVSKWDRN
jgi:hypothetical protein